MTETIREIYDRFNSDGGPLDQFQQQYGVFNGNGQTDFNAAAHAYTSAGLAYHHGSTWADIYGTGREVNTRISIILKEGRIPTENEFRDEARDVFNNRVGIKIAQYARENGLPESAMADLVGDALARGLLIVNEFNDSRIIDPSPQLVPYPGYLTDDAVYDGPSEDAARAMELQYGLPPGSLSTGSATGEGDRTYFDSPLTSPHPNPRPDLITEAGQMKALIDANPELLQLDGFVSYLREAFGSDLLEQILDQCFGPDVPIDMWPLDPACAPDPNNPYKQYVQDAVRAKIWKKPISQIKVGDWVVSNDKNGNLVPGYVPRTTTNTVKILLDFFGTKVTPGHVYYRPDSQKTHKFETLIDVLRNDGVLQKQDGTLVRAATNVPIDDQNDSFVKVVVGTKNSDGSIAQQAQGQLRLGARVILESGHDVSIAELIKTNGGEVGPDGLIRTAENPEGMPFHWTFSDRLPNPEDYVLQRSGVTLEDIYEADEWEEMRPQLPFTPQAHSSEQENARTGKMSDHFSVGDPSSRSPSEQLAVQMKKFKRVAQHLSKPGNYKRPERLQ